MRQLECDEAREALRQRLDHLGVVVEFTPKREGRPDWGGDGHAFHFDYKVKHGGETIHEGIYSVGSGIVERWAMEAMPRRCKGCFRGQRTVYDVQVLAAIRSEKPTFSPYTTYKKYRPEAVDLISSILLDASIPASHSGVDDFADEMGYTKPSEAIRAWEACKDAELAMRRLFGDYDAAVEEASAM